MRTWLLGHSAIVSGTIVEIIGVVESQITESIEMKR